MEMTYELTEELENYLNESQEELTELIRELCGIPAPSHREERRAAFCKEWLEKNGAEGVTIDEALNVIYPVGCEEGRDLIVFMAHMDTVFPELVPHPMREEEGKLFCPGVGDDTTNLAILLMLEKYIAIHKPQPKCGILFVANSCEEGLGNLKGSRQLMKDYGDRVRQVVSFDGYCTGMANRAVGSSRYRVEVRTEGGHAFGNFGNRSAIHQLSKMIDMLYAIKVPDKAPTTFNVGVAQGGTSVNTIAQQAEMLYEYRSEDKDCLQIMEDYFQGVIEAYRRSGITVLVEPLGQRPCGSMVDEEKLATLTQKGVDIITRYAGKRPVVKAASTDCNIPLSMGIPSLCLGTCLGGGAHTKGEWIELSSLPAGCRIAAAFVMDYFYP